MVGSECNVDISSFLNLLESRRSVRLFSDEPVSGECLDYILKCAKTAPSAGNRESWDVIVVSDDEVRFDLSRAALDQEHIMNAPLILVVCANYVRSMSSYGERGILYALEDSVIACTYMMLAAQASGLNTCWTGAFEDEDVREILNLPSHVRPVSLLAVGKGLEDPDPSYRMPLEEHVHHEYW